MPKRKIIEIDERKCNGCGECIPSCPEGALQIIDGKARLISDLFCDGLGACIGHCPQAAIKTEEREAQPYDERKVMGNIVKQGQNVIRAHLEHLKSHGEKGYLAIALDYLKEKGITLPQEGKLPCGCPGTQVRAFAKKEGGIKEDAGRIESSLTHWPVQLKLVPAFAPFLNDTDLLVAADCVPFAYADFHRKLLKGKVLLVGCPKLDDVSLYAEKLKQIFLNQDIRSVTYAHMEVPCCFGLISVIKEAVSSSGKDIPFKEVTVSLQGEILK